jgi:hypothetical protein
MPVMASSCCITRCCLCWPSMQCMCGTPSVAGGDANSSMSPRGRLHLLVPASLARHTDSLLQEHTAQQHLRLQLLRYCQPPPFNKCAHASSKVCAHLSHSRAAPTGQPQTAHLAAAAAQPPAGAAAVATSKAEQYSNVMSVHSKPSTCLQRHYRCRRTRCAG